MQLNKVLKGLLIAIPLVALTACSSSPDTAAGNEGSSTTNSGNSSMNSDSNGNSNVDVGVVEREETPEEKQAKQDAILRQKHTIYFDFDKSSVRYEYNELLEAHARFLVKNPNQRITIEGHCDERGTPEYNIALGERRAQSVAKFLTAMGVSDSQIAIVSYGEEKPADKSRTQAGFAKNRRAILVY